MTTEELLVAISVLRKALTHYAPHSGAVLLSCPDAELLRELLNEVKPYYDAEPITIEWLRIVGFEQDADRDYMRIMCNSDPYPTFLALCTDTDPKLNEFQACIVEYETLNDAKVFDRDQFSIISKPGTITTRGDVRRLCAVLGISLKVGA